MVFHWLVGVLIGLVEETTSAVVDRLHVNLVDMISIIQELMFSTCFFCGLVYSPQSYVLCVCVFVCTCAHMKVCLCVCVCAMCVCAHVDTCVRACACFNDLQI